MLVLIPFSSFRLLLLAGPTTSDQPNGRKPFATWPYLSLPKFPAPLEKLLGLHVIVPRNLAGADTWCGRLGDNPRFVLPRPTPTPSAAANQLDPFHRDGTTHVINDVTSAARARTPISRTLSIAVVGSPHSTLTS